MDSNPNTWIPVFLPPNILSHQNTILNATPISVVYPDQDHAARYSVARHYSDARHYSVAPHHFGASNHLVAPHHSAVPHHFDALHPSAAPHHSAALHISAPPHHSAISHHSNPNTWTPAFIPPNIFGNQHTILNPTPIRVMYPDQDLVAHHYSAAPHHSATTHHLVAPDHFTAPNHFDAPHHSDTISVLSTEDDDESDDGRTHSIPCEKNGPYTCPKCNCVFNTSQKFAAHMLSHYKSETNEEKDRRLRARNRKKYRKFMASLRRPKEKMELVAIE
ncbi:soluble scavenger receptor cysteine-rich domain-containing protein SSC5D [Capsella rubella]|nr:soluble scavenger receptor cysteine-rich domain-containing protein SSC5D [Capsella rubella]